MDIHYDETSPTFLRWGQTASPKVRGKPAGTLRPDGYYSVMMKGRLHRAHGVVWELQRGVIPDGFMIDHVDGSRCNNHIDNLRLATNSTNGHNRGVTSRSKSGHKGVLWDGRHGKWYVQVVVNKVKHWGGTFDCPELAALAASKLRQELHGEFARD